MKSIKTMPSVKILEKMSPAKRNYYLDGSLKWRVNYAYLKAPAFKINTDLAYERRRHIANSVIDLFSKKGYENTSVREIANACNLKMGSLYYYVNSKANAFNMMTEFKLREFLNSFEQFDMNNAQSSPADKLIDIIVKIFKAIDKHSDFIFLLYREMKNPELNADKIIITMEREVINKLEKLLHKFFTNGRHDIDDIKVMTRNIVIAGEMWALRKKSLESIYTFEQYIKQQIEYLYLQSQDSSS